MGVKLVQLLLHNRNLWWNREARHKPILMICYTNHALDQFLEFIVKECKLTNGVVRVGGRCKSEALEPYLLKNIKRKAKITKSISADIFYRIKDEYRRMSELSDKIKPKSKLIDLTHDCLLSFNSVSQICENVDYLKQLKTSANSPDFSLLVWLGFLESKLLSNSKNYLNQGLQIMIQFILCDSVYKIEKI